MSAEEPETEAGAANDATEVVDDDFSTRLRNVAGSQSETQFGEAWSDEDDAADDAESESHPWSVVTGHAAALLSVGAAVAAVIAVLGWIMLHKDRPAPSLPAETNTSSAAAPAPSSQSTSAVTTMTSIQPLPSTSSMAATTTSPVNVIPSTWTGVSQSPSGEGTIDSLPVTLVLDSSDPISGVMKLIGPQHTCTFQLSEVMRSSATNRVVTFYNTTGPCGGDNVTWSVILKPDQITGSLVTHPQNTFTLRPG
jgi:hypothetical protein